MKQVTKTASLVVSEDMWTLSGRNQFFSESVVPGRYLGCDFAVRVLFVFLIAEELCSMSTIVCRAFGVPKRKLR